MEIQIEDGISIPKTKRGRKSDLSVAFERLCVGQSFVQPAGRFAYLQARCWAQGKALNRKFTVRKVSDAECRVWRIK